MQATNDFSDVASMDNLYSYSKNRDNPKRTVAESVLKKETTHPLGVASKFIAGAMMGMDQRQQNQAAQAEMAERMRLGQILQDHESQGLHDDDTFKALLQEYAKTGSKMALSIASKLKPGVAKQPNAIDQLAKLTKARQDHLDAKGMTFESDPAKIAEFSAKDPTMKFIEDQINNIISPKMPAPRVYGGTSEDRTNDPSDFSGLKGVTPSIEMPSEAGGNPKFLAQDQLAEQNKKQKMAKDPEAIIQANMERYGRSREEVIRALKRKGAI